MLSLVSKHLLSALALSSGIFLLSEADRKSEVLHTTKQNDKRARIQDQSALKTLTLSWEVQERFSNGNNSNHTDKTTCWVPSLCQAPTAHCHI